MEAQKQLIIRSVLDAWNSRIETADKLFNSLSDEQLSQEVSPGRNRGVYLLGHLTAVHDKMLPLLNFGSQVYPHLDEPFLNNADKTVSNIPSTKELRENWKTVNSKLTSHFNKLTADEWFQRHTSVSEEDFVKEPHRNRLNVVVGRTNHMQYHIGQVALLKK
jgi:hypothetical protein